MGLEAVEGVKVPATPGFGIVLAGDDGRLFERFFWTRGEAKGVVVEPAGVTTLAPLATGIPDTTVTGPGTI